MTPPTSVQRTRSKTQFPTRGDITDDEMFDAIDDVLRLQSSRRRGSCRSPSSFSTRCSSTSATTTRRRSRSRTSSRAARHDSRARSCSSPPARRAHRRTPTLQKLTDRFSVPVTLSDTDVETVVREVVLRKKPEHVADSRPPSTRSPARSTGTSAARGSPPKAADKPTLVPDYPLLPTRRRFWERALRAIDKAGKAGVLRTQLKIVHEAARSVADQPARHVIGADFLFRRSPPACCRAACCSRRSTS